jgi:hypothetical protein
LYCVKEALSYLSLQCETCDEIEVKGNGQRKQASGGEINKNNQHGIEKLPAGMNERYESTGGTNRTV